MDLINDYVEGRVQIGRIDFFTRYSLFDVEEKSARRVVEALRQLDFLVRNVKVDFATEEQMARGSKERNDGGDRGGNSYPKRRDNASGRPGSGYQGRGNDGGGHSREGGYSRGNDSRPGKDYGKRSNSGYSSHNKKTGPSTDKSSEVFKRKRY